MTKNQIKFAREVFDEYPSEKEVYAFSDGNVFLSAAKTHALNHARATGKQYSLIRRDVIDALEAAIEAAEKAAAEAAEKAAAEAAEKAKKAAKEAAEKAAAEAAEKAAAEAAEKAKKAAKEAAEKAAKAVKTAKKTDKEVELPKPSPTPVPEPEQTGSIDDIINHAD